MFPFCLGKYFITLFTALRVNKYYVTSHSCNCFNAYYRVLMVEAYGTLDQVMNYYGTPSAPGGHFPFNFRFITDVHYSPPPPSSAEDISRTINEYLDRVTDGRTANWVVCTCSVSRSVLFRREASWGHWRSTVPTVLDTMGAWYKDSWYDLCYHDKKCNMVNEWRYLMDEYLAKVSWWCNWRSEWRWYCS
jgi:hypothetical protein